MLFNNRADNNLQVAHLEIIQTSQNKGKGIILR